MQPEEDRQLWELLGRAQVPKVSPFFARNIVRRLREETSSARSRAKWFPWRIWVPAMGAAVITLGAMVFLHNSPLTNKSASPVAAASESHIVTPISGEVAVWPGIADQPLEARSDPSAEIIAQIDEQDYEVVQNLDILMTTYETSLWDENSKL